MKTSLSYKKKSIFCCCAEDYIFKHNLPSGVATALLLELLNSSNEIIIEIYISADNHKNFKPKHINDLFNVSEYFFIFSFSYDATNITLINNKGELLLPAVDIHISSVYPP